MGGRNERRWGKVQDRNMERRHTLLASKVTCTRISPVTGSFSFGSNLSQKQRGNDTIATQANMPWQQEIEERRGESTSRS